MSDAGDRLCLYVIDRRPASCTARNERCTVQASDPSPLAMTTLGHNQLAISEKSRKLPETTKVINLRRSPNPALA